MGIEHFSHSKTREPAMKGVGRVLNAAELLIKKNVKMANFMLCLFYYPKNVWEKLSRLSCYSVKAWAWLKIDKLLGGCRLELSLGMKEKVPRGSS